MERHQGRHRPRCMPQLKEFAVSSQRLAGLRVLITQANEFMGPTLCEVFAEQGAVVLADDGPLTEARCDKFAARAAIS